MASLCYNISSLLILIFVLQVSASVIRIPKDQTACTEADWSDILFFLIVNYVAHVATVVRFLVRPPGSLTGGDVMLFWHRSLV